MLSDLDTRKNEIIEALNYVENNDAENMVFRMELTCREIEKLLDMKYIDASSTRYTLPTVIYEISDNILMLQSLLPDDVEVKNTTDYNRLKSNLTTNKTEKFTKKSFSIQY